MGLFGLFRRAPVVRRFTDEDESQIRAGKQRRLRGRAARRDQRWADAMCRQKETDRA